MKPVFSIAFLLLFVVSQVGILHAAYCCAEESTCCTPREMKSSCCDGESDECGGGEVRYWRVSTDYTVPLTCSREEFSFSVPVLGSISHIHQAAFRPVYFTSLTDESPPRQLKHFLAQISIFRI